MEIADDLHCLFSASVREHNGSYIIEIPKHELKHGAVRVGQPYRVGLLSHVDGDEAERKPKSPPSPSKTDAPTPPVDEGEVRDVTIETIGDQGDGIARVERGYVIIVPDTNPDEEVTIRITDVQQNVAFATVVDRVSDPTGS